LIFFFFFLPEPNRFSLSSKLFPQSLYPASNSSDDKSEPAKLKEWYNQLDFAERAAVDQLRPELRSAILELTVKAKMAVPPSGGEPNKARSPTRENDDYWAQVVEIAKLQAAALSPAKPGVHGSDGTKNVIHFIDPNVPSSLVKSLDGFTHATTTNDDNNNNETKVTPLADDFLPVLEFLDRYVLDVSLYRFAALQFFFAWLTRAAALTTSKIDYTYQELIMLQTKPGVVATFLDRTTRLMAALESRAASSAGSELAALTRLREHLLQKESTNQQQELSFEQLVTLSQEQMLTWLVTTTALGMVAVMAGVWLYAYTDGAILTMSLKDLLELYRANQSAE
jgi:hypothetical protein